MSATLQIIDQISAKLTALMDNYMQLEEAYFTLLEEKNLLTNQIEEQKNAITLLQEKLLQLDTGDNEFETINAKRKREHLKAAINDVIKEVDKCLTSLKS
ncbi:MAG TPA: hypothetical protein PK239_12655 [Chitinophagales bacterium]|nr:hypothetical protein [Chitinophagales bacterium]